ncbi:MAG: xanthine dehydrogenase family protein subunit M [Deltaproteobacteria bacterium]|jgi:carbon-monoxide dehydrogenase medium subunit|nr:xanthine dehydrogenase family protein subunit M [Deltaproteobacteria bacterium]
MTLPYFDYVAAKSLKEASELVSGRPGKCLLMAGGTDIICGLKDNVIKGIETIVDLKTIPDLVKLEYDEAGGLKIGAGVKLYQIHSSPMVREKLPAVAEAAHYVASLQIRRKATLVGNICNASPSADTAGILLAMGAKVKTWTPSGGRTIDIDNFFTGVKKTCLEKGEIVTEVIVPSLKSGEGSAYFKHAVRKAMDLAIIGVAAWVRLDGRRVVDCRMALGGVATTPMRAREAEKVLIGQEPTEEILEKAGLAASKECKPISDVRASADYRADMIRVFTKRAVAKAVESLKA